MTSNYIIMLAGQTDEDQDYEHIHSSLGLKKI